MLDAKTPLDILLNRTSTQDKNQLFPIFLKLNQLNILLVGGGNVGLEKLVAILNNSPKANITIIAPVIKNEILELSRSYSNIVLVKRVFQEEDIDQRNMIVCATDDKGLHVTIQKLAKAKGILINVADTPELCDFYLGSIVQKGSLKIAISTNGKSPTVAKRVKQFINELIPGEIDEVLDNVQLIRNNLKGDFDEKVKHLNELTKVLVSKNLDLSDGVQTKSTKKWQRIVLFCIVAFIVILVSHALLSYISFDGFLVSIKTAFSTVDTNVFLLMLLTGFLAQMVDGSMGMGYGTISTTFLLAIGVSPAIVSSRVHSARVFSSGVAGYSHHRFGNINKKLFRTIALPGLLGAIAGAALAVLAQNRNLSWVRIPLSIYTLYLGYFIIRKAYNKSNKQDKVKRAGWLATIGGFLDAFAGGGWGALVTSTLISKRRSPRYVVGSVCLAEFFVVFASAVTFFILLKHFPIMDILGLIIGGVIAGPIAARLVGKLPLKTMYLSVGCLVIATSLFTLFKVISKLI